ncbi:hypothetical protein HK097_007014 [Rhizophlyctis rosea]|uniref:SUN-like protein 1 n=1 Tax=Rhizophlyctis rosea TaxID=64517 RepID=A0AAD5SCM6_9FUNG|nr:hypothetical protein HK097_007014 [Rhizophlyctis rosea]
MKPHWLPLFYLTSVPRLAAFVLNTCPAVRDLPGVAAVSTCPNLLASRTTISPLDVASLTIDRKQTGATSNEGISPTSVPGEAARIPINPKNAVVITLDPVATSADFGTTAPSDSTPSVISLIDSAVVSSIPSESRPAAPATPLQSTPPEIAHSTNSINSIESSQDTAKPSHSPSVEPLTTTLTPTDIPITSAHQSTLTESLEAPFPSSSASTPYSTSTPSPTPQNIKSSKERFNYASFDCGALVLSQNREATSATAILLNSKDQYMLNKCSAQKFVVVEICEDILVDTVMLANYEFFSSTFKDFKIYVSDRYPPKEGGWKLLGNFKAKNVRDVQVFKIENPLIWARYLKVEFVTHYGHEYFCPITLMRVYGTTMMEEMKAEEERERLTAATVEVDDLPIPSALVRVPGLLTLPNATSVIVPGVSVSPSFPELSGRGLDSSALQKLPARGSGAGRRRYANPSGSEDGGEEGEDEGQNSTSESYGSDNTASSASDTFSKQPSSTATAQPLESLFTDHFRKFEDNDLPDPSSTDPRHIPQFPNHHTSQSTDTETSTTSTLHIPHDTLGTSSIHTPPPITSHGNGGTQESIFKTILKRINVLERNASLSYKYLEEQSKALNQLFVQLEYTDRERIGQVLEGCNRTLTRSFEDMQRDYKRTWYHMYNEMEYNRISAEQQMKVLTDSVGQLRTQLAVQFFLLVAALVWSLSKNVPWGRLPLVWRVSTSDNGAVSPTIRISEDHDEESVTIPTEGRPGTPSNSQTNLSRAEKKRRKRRRSTIGIPVTQGTEEFPRLAALDIDRDLHRSTSLSPSSLRPRDRDRSGTPSPVRLASGWF